MSDYKNITLKCMLASFMGQAFGRYFRKEKESDPYKQDLAENKRKLKAAKREDNKELISKYERERVEIIASYEGKNALYRMEREK